MTSGILFAIIKAQSDGRTFAAISKEEIKEELERLNSICLFEQITMKLIDTFQDEGFGVDYKPNDDIDIIKLEKK